MESESDKGEGRGLPVGWGWRPRTGAWNEGEVDLYPPGADVGEERATAYPSGKWETWEEDRIAERLNKGTATPRSGETLLAAAQVAAEAALWATDGYGTGEVRGLRVEAWEMGHGDPGVLPGLPGRWDVTDVRPAEGGVEVDAVRAPVPVDKAARAWASIGQIADDGSHPVDAVRAPAVGPDEHSDECAYYFADAGDADALCDCGKGEPAPREPSAPADGAELARLTVERDDAQAGLWEWEQRALKAEGEADTLRARAEEAERRVAELEVANANALRVVEELQATRATYSDRRAAEAIEATLADEQSLINWLRAHGHGPALDAGRSGVDVAIGLLATPPPGTVAALLARVEEARAEKAATGIAHDDREHRIYASGMAGGLYAAADLIRATLAPSPLDGVVAEAVALPVPPDPREGVDVDGWIDEIHGICLNDSHGRRDLARIARVALAGMLACDAPATKEPT